MIGADYVDIPCGDAGRVIPWLKENPLREIMDKRKKEAEETLQDIAEKEKEIIKLLPEEVRELIKVPDLKELLEEY
ncbi:hypothetical protein [Thermococcus sp.]|uniref:hypothetical protein n=1 Tax=Thermococcus sp. TaxID=35749 RepID=UPI00263510D8|nr:hypothetical protein [Thermococcus sp.]